MKHWSGNAGTAMSQLVAGAIADEAGFAAMFVTLSVFACFAWCCIFLLKETG
jgi:sugar phosphate permease